MEPSRRPPASITWSGSALHEGPLPGHAASHGCIRLPGSFASSLFKVTKLGARDRTQAVVMAYEMGVVRPGG